MKAGKKGETEERAPCPQKFVSSCAAREMLADALLDVDPREARADSE